MPSPSPSAIAPRPIRSRRPLGISLATAMFVTLVPTAGWGLAPAAATTTASPAAWGDCPSDVTALGAGGAAPKCTTITVPMDYANPGAGTFDILATGFFPTGTPKGAILGNPGGPGGSALNFWDKDFIAGTPAEMYRDYVLIGLQPRGLEHAVSAVCSTAAECNEKADEAYRKTLTTANIARDMDELRKAMGLDKISYYGASWGTQLGATYATLFPSRVDKMVLDSNTNPATQGVGLGKFADAESTLVFERRLYDFFDWAATNDEVLGLGDTPYKVYSAWNTARLTEDSASWVHNYLPPALREADLPELLRPGADKLLPGLNTLIEIASKQDYAARLAKAVAAGEVWSLDASRELATSGLLTNAISMMYNRSRWSNYAAQIDLNMRPLNEAALMTLIEAGKITMEELETFGRSIGVTSALVGDGAGLAGYQGTAVNLATAEAGLVPTQSGADPKLVALQEAAEKAYKDAIAAGESSATIRAKYLISDGYLFMAAGYVKPQQFSGAGLSTAPLLLQSVDDPATTASGGSVLAEQLGGKLITVDGGDHGVFRRDNAVLNQAVLDYLATGKVSITTAPEAPAIATASPLARFRQLIAEVEGESATPIVGPTIPDTPLNRLLSGFGPNVDADSVVPKPVFADPDAPVADESTAPAEEPVLAAGVASTEVPQKSEESEESQTVATATTAETPSTSTEPTPAVPSAPSTDTAGAATPGETEATTEAGTIEKAAASDTASSGE